MNVAWRECGCGVDGPGDPVTKHEAERIEVNISTARGLAAKQIAYHLFTIPKPYFHLMSMVTHFYTAIESLSSAGRTATAWKEHFSSSSTASPSPVDDENPLSTLIMNVFCAMLTIFVVTAMHTVTIWISNPVGRRGRLLTSTHTCRQ